MKRYYVYIKDIEWPSKDDGEINYFCDGCGARLNEQKGFEFSLMFGRHLCDECGMITEIDGDFLDLPEEEEIVAAQMDNPIVQAEKIVKEYLELKYGLEPLKFSIQWKCLD